MPANPSTDCAHAFQKDTTYYRDMGVCVCVLLCVAELGEEGMRAQDIRLLIYHSRFIARR